MTLKECKTQRVLVRIKLQKPAEHHPFLRSFHINVVIFISIFICCVYIYIQGERERERKKKTHFKYTSNINQPWSDLIISHSDILAIRFLAQTIDSTRWHPGLYQHEVIRLDTRLGIAVGALHSCATF